MSDLTKFITYNEEGDPVLVIHKKQRAPMAYSSDKAMRDAYSIPLNDAWQFSEDHYPAPVECVIGFDRNGIPVMEKRWLSFEKFMFFKTQELCEVLGLGESTTRRMVEIAEIIESGLEDLIKTPPRAEESVCVGEVKLEIGNKSQGKQTFENDLIINKPVMTIQ